MIVFKDELRKNYLAKKKSLSREERAEMSARIFDQFFNSFDLSSIKCLHCFITIEKLGEIETMDFFRRIWREFPEIVTVVPKVDKASNELQQLLFTPDTELVRNPWGIHEPADEEFVDAGLIDMVLTPGLVFDSRGHRVGYGKGYYDRFFQRCRKDCVKIGLSFFSPVAAIGDIHDGDVEMDHLITPDRLYTFHSGNLTGRDTSPA